MADLLHEVSLRSTSNKMDSYNLAVVLTPNLVKSSNQIKDVQICAIPNAPTPHRSSNRPSHPADLTPTSAESNTTTLGQIIKLCVERYFEVFDEVRDPTEVRRPRIVEPRQHEQEDQEREEGQEIVYRRTTLQGPISPSLHSHPSRNRDSIIEDDDDDEDHEIFVMPIGPRHSHSNSNSGAWTPVGKLNSLQPTSPRSAYHTTTSTTTTSPSSPSSPITPYGTVTRAKSLISFDKSSNGNTTKRGGTISIGSGSGGRGGGRGSGSGVEAVGITASGFFVPPGGDVPPPPPRHPSVSRA